MQAKPKPFDMGALERFFRGAQVEIPDHDSIAYMLTHPKKRLRVKLGIDPTTPDFHIGYLVVFRKLKILQDFGHQIVLLVGGFTARFGDPTEKSDTRNMRGVEEMKSGVAAFKKQYGKVLDAKKTEIRDNSEWYDSMSAEDLLRLMSETTVAQMLERDMFKTRMKEGKAIGLHEPVYPLLQGYDSVELKSDLTVIGTDQLFNENTARSLQERRGADPQMIVALELIPGTDGNQKMSQSLGNAILLNESPEEQFGKLMSVPDNAAITYAKMLTDIDMREVETAMKGGGIAARDIKLQIAKTIVGEMHGEEKADAAQTTFLKQFQEGGVAEDIEIIVLEEETISAKKLLLASGLADSLSDAKRVIAQGGMQVNKRPVLNPDLEVTLTKKEQLVQRGKRRAVYVKL